MISVGARSIPEKKSPQYGRERPSCQRGGRLYGLRFVDNMDESRSTQTDSDAGLYSFSYLIVITTTTITTTTMMKMKMIKMMIMMTIR